MVGWHDWDGGENTSDGGSRTLFKNGSINRHDWIIAEIRQGEVITYRLRGRCRLNSGDRGGQGDVVGGYSVPVANR